MPTAPAVIYCVNDDVRKLLSSKGVNLRLDDDGTGSVESAEELNLTTCVYDATEEINSYLLGRYDAANLANSYLVNRWAKYLAAKEVCERRGNTVPKPIVKVVGDADEQTGIMGRLVRIAQGIDSIQGIPERVAPGPAMSNVRVDIRYPLRRIRVERPLSEQTPVQGPPQVPDLGADFIPYPL